MAEPKREVPRGYQQLTALNAGAKQVTVPRSAAYALIRCTGGDVRWRDDGGEPTATLGYPLKEGEELLYDLPSALSALRFAATTAGAEVSINYYG